MPPDAPDLPPELEAVATLGREGLEAVRLTDAVLVELQAPSVGIDACVLERVVLAGARMTGAYVRDTELRDCDLANADLRDARLRRVEGHGGRLTGAVLTGADLGDVLLEGCRADVATFAGGQLHHMRLPYAICARPIGRRPGFALVLRGLRPVRRRSLQGTVRRG